MAARKPGRRRKDANKRCFLISAYGTTPEEQRASKQVLRHLVERVLQDDYEVVRADQIDDEGLITNQIIDHLLEDELVIADLTGLNPNVFYEVAVRHAARLPIVHLITKGERIPFDVANMRAVQYALDDPDALEEAQQELARKVKAIENADFKAGPNPVTAARDVKLLQESDQPDVREQGQILGVLSRLSDEVEVLSRRVAAMQPTQERIRMTEARLRNVLPRVVAAHGTVTAEAAADELRAPVALTRKVLEELANDSAIEVYEVGGSFSTIPF